MALGGEMEMEKDSRKMGHRILEFVGDGIRRLEFRGDGVVGWERRLGEGLWNEEEDWI